MVAITYECPNCHRHQGHAEDCPSWYEQPSTEQPASAAGSIAFTDGTLRDVNNTNQLAPAPAAQETGEWRVAVNGSRAIVIDDEGRSIAFGAGNSNKERQQHALQIVRDHNEHQSLSAERERLRAALREAAEWFHATHRYVFGEIETCDHSQCVAIRTALNEQGKELG